MKRLRQRWILLVVSVMLSGPAVAGQAKPVPLNELTQDLIRTRVGGYLALDTTRRKLSTLDALVRLDAVQITYRSVGGRPVELVWTYEQVEPLTGTQKAIVAVNLEDVLTNVFRTYQGGLLSDEDTRAVLQVARYQVAPPADGGEKIGRPRERPQPTQPQPAPSETAEAPMPLYTATVCYYAAPSYWGSPYCGCSYWAVPVVTYHPLTVYSAPMSSIPAAVSAAPVPQEKVALAFSAVRRKLLLKGKRPEDAPGLYVRGVEAYGQGDYQEAADLLSVAVKLDSQDARYWYYKALSERALGDRGEAQVSARRGAALELLGRADPDQTVKALERIQGVDRRFLRAARDVNLTREAARRIAAEPVADPMMETVRSAQVQERERTVARTASAR